MKFQRPIIFLAALLIGVGIVLGLGRLFKVGDNTGKSTSTVSAEVKSTDRRFGTRSSGSMNQGDVLIELTPKYIAPGKLIVKFAMNTHTVDLSRFNLKEITVLRYDSKEVKPTEANRLRGHHSFGLIVFDLDENPEKFSITITGIPKENTRTFLW
ncbi:MAG: hypothetical protein GXO97_04810 [Nitrospirae bacterium]|nr:hypothetical protein [Nitrospirota bacterium]